ncbi:hypothetical protein [Streptomyces sp. SID13031]|uniref:hypothetical protein n=1 Tax=Streptomyces sp. SID13031 TaxID=2706046 RepID=UPI0013CB8310|nr:hypothetical protein [Streptomyces sp. SID13031]NEA31266.1 hypothetical protein [Streptomyces sp. SID13031]
MSYLVAAVIVVGALCGVDLLLTVALIRRLRQHLEQESETSGPIGGLVAEGTHVAQFTAVTADGEAIGADMFRSGVIAFMSTTCKACTDQLPAFIGYLSDSGPGRDRTLAVVVGSDTPDGDHLVAELAQHAHVVREELDGPIGIGFNARVFPAFYLLDDRLTIAGSSIDPARLGVVLPT